MTRRPALDDGDQGFVLVIVGGLLVRLGLTTTSLAYVKSGMRPLLVLAGAALVVLGAPLLVRALRRPDAPARGHAPGVAWMLLLPVFTLLVVTPPALGSFAAGLRGPSVAPTAGLGAAPLPASTTGTTELSLVDFYYRAVLDGGQSVRGRRVRLLGFVAPASGPGHDYLLSRFVLSCCAADAQALQVGVSGDTTPRPPDTWVEVTGSLQPAPPGEELELPVLDVDAVRRVPPPAQPYEY